MINEGEKEAILGVIGGSGIYEMEGAQVVREHSMTTPFGQPSDAIIETKIHGRPVYFLPRHGRGHRYTPSEVPYCANVFALKKLGVTHLMAVSAVGIMREDIRPGDMVVPDQIFDRTKGSRRSTFFGDGIVGHVQFADPFSMEMRQLVLSAAKNSGATVHDGGTYVCMEGPQFSTRAESHFYRKTLAPTVIGMTALPEAKLAREAEMCYGMLALATDYDCWHESEVDVSVEAVLAVLKQNSTMAKTIVKEAARLLPARSVDPVLSAAKYAIITDKSSIPIEVKAKMAPLWGQYL